YQAVQGGGAAVNGVIEAEDRRAALNLLGERGLFPSQLEVCASNGNGAPPAPLLVPSQTTRPRLGFGTGIKRKEITALTGELAALLGAGISIPQALEALGQEEENPRLRQVIMEIS